MKNVIINFFILEIVEIFNFKNCDCLNAFIIQNVKRIR